MVLILSTSNPKAFIFCAWWVKKSWLCSRLVVSHSCMVFFFFFPPVFFLFWAMLSNLFLFSFFQFLFSSIFLFSSFEPFSNLLFNSSGIEEARRSGGKKENSRRSEKGEVEVGDGRIGWWESDQNKRNSGVKKKKNRHLKFINVFWLYLLGSWLSINRLLVDNKKGLEQRKKKKRKGKKNKEKTKKFRVLSLEFFFFFFVCFLSLFFFKFFLGSFFTNSLFVCLF